MSRRGWLATGVLWLASGCAGSMSWGGIDGVCSARQTQCLETRCKGLKAPRDCEQQCEYEARRCQRSPSGSVKAQTVSSERALLIELSETGIRHSRDATAKIVGAAQPLKGAYQFPPGAGLQMSFTLPPQVRSAELHLVHGPGGDGANCFITATVGNQTLVGRYAPPRGGRGALRRETWNLGRFVEPSPKPTTVNIFVFNNNVAGSRNPYLLGGVELFYRAVEPEPPADEAL